MTDTLLPGFADPVADAQACFRAVLGAMSRPGTIHAISGIAPPAPLDPATAGVLLTLIDQETPLWLDPSAEAARPWIAFHTGASTVPPSAASFALALSLPVFDDLPNGTDEAPETAATVILQVAALSHVPLGHAAFGHAPSGRGQNLILEGPGLRASQTLPVYGLPRDFAAIWQRNHALFPRGIDLILCAGNQLAALPRSVSIREG